LRRSLGRDSEEVARSVEPNNGVRDDPFGMESFPDYSENEWKESKPVDLVALLVHASGSSFDRRSCRRKTILPLENPTSLSKTVGLFCHGQPGDPRVRLVRKFSGMFCGKYRQFGRYSD
jgi:hypothetical protein